MGFAIFAAKRSTTILVSAQTSGPRWPLLESAINK